MAEKKKETLTTASGSPVAEACSMKSKHSSGHQMSYWQLIFSQSKVNGAPYNDDELPVYNWDWPRNTYLQRRRSLNESLTVFGPADSQVSERDDARF